MFFITTLRYGNTNTFFIKGENGGLLIDTDSVGTLPAFFKSIKSAGIGMAEINYVLATHYHPDHIGLISELTGLGVKLLLADTQTDHVHFSDGIFEKANIPYSKIDETSAVVISCESSRGFLSSIGIGGEIVSIPSHSGDSIALVLDDGNCIVGDLEPYEYMDGYEDNEALARDWETLMSYKPKTVFYAHRPESVLR